MARSQVSIAGPVSAVPSQSGQVGSNGRSISFLLVLRISALWLHFLCLVQSKFALSLIVKSFSLCGRMLLTYRSILLPSVLLVLCFQTAPQVGFRVVCSSTL